MKKGLLLQLLTAGALLLPAAHTQAQLVDCNVFLQGNFMEIGINNNGAFGSTIAAPSGYHPTTTDTMHSDCGGSSFYVVPQMGFVVDPNEDGWTTGTPPYYGDYIMQENPREGWAIEDSTSDASAYSYYYHQHSLGYSGPLSGGSTTYTSSGGILQGGWSGNFYGTTDSLTITQTTTVDVATLYLNVHVTFTNIASTGTGTFYYVRVLNPHTDEMTSGTPINLNKIEHQLPNPDGLVVVSATGTQDTMGYVALGTRDPRAKCFIIRDSTLPGPSSLAAIYAGDTGYQYSDTLTGNYGIGLIYQLTLGPGPGTSLDLDFGYSFKSGVIDTVLDSALIDSGIITSLGVTKATANHARNIPVYPNPATNVLNIGGLLAGDTYTLYDVTGRAVTQGTAYSQGVKTISVEGLPAGLYMLTVRDVKGNTVGKQPVTKE